MTKTETKNQYAEKSGKKTFVECAKMIVATRVFVIVMVMILLIVT